MHRSLQHIIDRMILNSTHESQYAKEIEALERLQVVPLVRPGLVKNEYCRITNPEDPKLFFCEKTLMLMPHWNQLGRESIFALRVLYSLYLHCPLLTETHGTNIIESFNAKRNFTLNTIKTLRIWHKYWYGDEMAQIRYVGIGWRERGKPLSCTAIEMMTFKCFRRIADRTFSTELAWYDRTKLDDYLSMPLDRMNADAELMSDPVISSAVEQQYRINRTRGR